MKIMPNSLISSENENTLNIQIIKVYNKIINSKTLYKIRQIFKYIDLIENLNWNKNLKVWEKKKIFSS